MRKPVQRPSGNKSPVTARLAVGCRLYGAIVLCDDLSSKANAGHDLIQWGFHDLMSFVSKRRAIKQQARATYPRRLDTLRTPRSPGG